MDQENSEKAVDTYDQFVGSEVFLLDGRGRKMMSRVTKREKDDYGISWGIENPVLFADHSLY